jgi:hypothetical protein
MLLHKEANCFQNTALSSSGLPFPGNDFIEGVGEILKKTKTLSEHVGIGK